jgi:ssDNA-binding Zn-finger/Zn-ribbon topoisomerase 1
MGNNTLSQNTKISDIRSQFDEVLNYHILRLTNTKDDDAFISLSLNLIACLYLSVERENEIKAFPESPPERYTREAFLTDIEEIGIDPNDDVMLAIQDLTQYNFVKISSKDRYTAAESATELIGLLETIFPLMPGMSLVAYVIQSIDEVVSGRKDFETALQNFEQTLEKQGVSLSDADSSGLNTLSKSSTAFQQFEKQDPAALAERRETHLSKLKELREKSLSRSKDPTIVSRQGYFHKVEVREVFPKAQPAPPEGISASETEILGPESIPAPESIDAGEIGADADATVQNDDTEATPLDGAQDQPVESDLPDEDIDQSIEESQEEPLTEEPLTKEELIEQQIQAYEAELAMPCPVCHIGKILSDETEKGKIYYHCSNEECKLISWGKPYQTACPVCKNPFLIEFAQKDGSIGLKCPRATCQFRKKDFDGLSLPNGGVSSSGKKLVAVRKKRGKKGVRRVVRKRKK